MQTRRQLFVPTSGLCVFALAGTAAAALGVLAARDPVIALLAVLGAAAMVLFVADLTTALFVFVALSFLEAFPKLLSVVTVAKALGLLLVLSWLASVAVRRRGLPSLLSGRPSLLALLALFLTWVGVSLLWAQESGPVVTEMTRFLPLFALFPVVYAALSKRENAATLAMIVIGGALMSATAGLMYPLPADAPGAGRLTGAGVAHNALAPVLVSGAVLAVAFAGMKSRPILFRFAAVAAGCFCIIGLVLTGSRGGFIALIVALTAGVIFAGRARRARVLSIVVVAALLTIVSVVAFAPPSVRDRLTATGDGSGRRDIWRVGVEMVKANPVLGVGAGNFQTRAPEYVLEAGLIRRNDLIVGRPRGTHNIYLRVLSQLGIVGLLLFVGIIASALAANVAAARSFARQKDEQMELIARAVFVGLCGMLAAGFFGSWVFSKPLWLLLAMGPALHALSRSTSHDVKSPSHSYGLAVRGAALR